MRGYADVEEMRAKLAKFESANIDPQVLKVAFIAEARKTCERTAGLSPQTINGWDHAQLFFVDDIIDASLSSSG